MCVYRVGCAWQDVEITASDWGWVGNEVKDNKAKYRSGKISKLGEESELIE